MVKRGVLGRLVRSTGIGAVEESGADAVVAGEGKARLGAVALARCAASPQVLRKGLRLEDAVELEPHRAVVIRTTITDMDLVGTQGAAGAGAVTTSGGNNVLAAHVALVLVVANAGSHGVETLAALNIYFLTVVATAVCGSLGADLGEDVFLFVDLELGGGVVSVVCGEAHIGWDSGGCASTHASRERVVDDGDRAGGGKSNHQRREAEDKLGHRALNWFMKEKNGSQVVR